MVTVVGVAQIVTKLLTTVTICCSTADLEVGTPGVGRRGPEEGGTAEIDFGVVPRPVGTATGPMSVTMGRLATEGGSLERPEPRRLEALWAAPTAARPRSSRDLTVCMVTDENVNLCE